MKGTKRLLILMLFFALYSCKEDAKTNTKEEKNNEAIYTSSVSDSTCNAHSSWFTIVGGNRKTPPPNEGSTSPFANNDSVTNCDFHQWSWQKFLWLTNEVDGKPLFLDSLKQVSPSGTILNHANGIILTDTSQASHVGDILKTPSTPSNTVFYAIFMNDLLHNKIVQYAPLAKNDPTSVQDSTFPVGALEVKTSWIAASALTDTSSYFITAGSINGVATRVALLGMHVVGIVENHPEFVWATFEHEELAPKYDWDKATDSTDAPVTSTVDYPFFKAGDTATVQNITSQNGIFTNVFSVYKFGTPVEIVGDSLTFMTASQDGEQNFNNISSINDEVKNQLLLDKTKSDSIWHNYFYNGSIWINTEGYVGTTAQAQLLDSLGYKIYSDSGDLTRGSVAAYNITMETYVQIGFPPVSPIYEQTSSNLTNCFACHNASNSGHTSPLYISHVFTGYLDNLNGLNRTQIKQKHVDEIKKHFQMRMKDKK